MTQQGIAKIAAFLSSSGAWNHGTRVRGYGLQKAYVSQGRWILTGAARDGVYALIIKC